MPEDGTGPRVFVSFRNGDEPFAAALLYRALARRFGLRTLFRSSESIRPGEPWAEAIWRSHRDSVAVVAVIGPRWLDIADEAGERRLFQDDDWVRLEVARALADGKTVIPVLVEGARRPTRDDLPADLARLPELQSVLLSHRRIDHTISALTDVLGPLLGSASSDRSAPQDGPAPIDADWLGVLKIPPGGAVTVEREQPLRALREALRGDGGEALHGGAPAPVVLHGGVGVGKSCLAVEYFRRNAGDYQAAWWIAAQRPELIPAQLSGLAAAAGFEVGRDVTAGLPALFGQLRRRGRWLLVLDGLEDPGVLGPLLAGFGAGGDVLVTSRTSQWGTAAVARVAVGPFERAQSLALLGGYLGTAAPAELDRLATALDDIPLAVAQAAAFLSAASLDVATYTDLLATRAGELLARGETYQYPGSLAAAWELGLDRLARTAPASVDLVELSGVLAPAPVPLLLPRRAAVALPATLAEAAADPIRWSDLIGAVADSGLVPVEDGALHPGALFQSFVRGRLPSDREHGLREAARGLLAAARPGDPKDPGSWEEYGTLLPHAFAVDLAASPDAGCRGLLLQLVEYLVVRGDAATARDLAASALQRWGADAQPDDPLLLDASTRLAQAYYRLGDYASAAALDEQVLARRTRVYGPDHHETLAAAHNLAIDSWARDGAPSAAAAFDDVVEHRRRVLGADHPETLRSTHNLALALRASGNLVRALELDEENLRRMTRILGPEHPDTLRSAYATALDLRGLGRWQSAATIDQDTYTRRRAVLGPDHPDTLRSAYAVAVGLRRDEDAGALALARETRERCRRVLGDADRTTLRCGLLLGELLVESGDEETGTLLCEEAARGLLDLVGWPGPDAWDRVTTGRTGDPVT